MVPSVRSRLGVVERSLLAVRWVGDWERAEGKIGRREEDREEGKGRGHILVDAVDGCVGF